VKVKREKEHTHTHTHRAKLKDNLAAQERRGEAYRRRKKGGRKIRKGLYYFNVVS
jgi:hypothetical protein